MFKDLVITPNNKIKEYRDIIAGDRAQARKREHTQSYPPILAIRYLPEPHAYFTGYQEAS